MQVTKSGLKEAARNALDLGLRKLPIAEDRAEELRRRFQVRFYKKGIAAGKAHPRTRSISLHLPLLKENPDQALDTVTHEVAHVLAFELGEFGHGPKWKRAHRVIGGTAKRCHRMDVTKHKARRTRFHLWETESGHQVWLGAVRHKRALQGTKYRHRDHGWIVKDLGKSELR